MVLVEDVLKETLIRRQDHPDQVDCGFRSFSYLERGEDPFLSKK
jgi:hypothetical protein